MRKWIIFIISFILLTQISACQKKKKSEINEWKATWTFQLDDGRVLSGKDLDGKVRILNFWATWCGPCREELPELVRFYQEFREKDVVLIGISVDENPDDVRSFIDEYNLNYPIVTTGPNGEWAKRFNGPPWLPITVIYGKDGKRVRTLIGPQSYERLKAIISELIQE